ncbi:hypothetical protein GGX14DRAFT_388267 [Mycena pura]|uniref:Bromodomain associated domain-containing protein n=1 Tax=Mycena pura TaxID=153505 RepID=A0AAD6YL42_9AGAR|nr:hypothetical protein GGX14DRAFT_388267 [Mycena pura]
MPKGWCPKAWSARRLEVPEGLFDICHPRDAALGANVRRNTFEGQIVHHAARVIRQVCIAAPYYRNREGESARAFALVEIDDSAVPDYTPLPEPDRGRIGFVRFETEEVEIAFQLEERKEGVAASDKRLYEKRIAESSSALMEYAAYKLLESATHRSIHAAAFSRASTHASAVLTDLLVRYISLLASTSAKYAQHAGRTTVASADALEALDELGFGLQDLIDYVPEAKELSRYAVYSARRVEELHEFKAHLGRNSRDDAFPLTYSQYEEEELDEEEEEEEEEDEEGSGDEAPPLKRQRTLSWDGQIPDFLPPFPTMAEAPESPRAESPQPMLPPPPSGGAPLVPQLTATSTSAADYLQQIPYDQSSLAEVSQWHLPSAPPHVPSRPTPSTELALYKAFHHILSNPQRTPGQATPARHRVALALLTYTQLAPRWELADTMYASSSHAAPRAWPIVPTFAVPVGVDPVPRRFPPTSRIVAAPERPVPLVGAQGSRLPELARRVLPPPIYARVTRLAHPGPLSRGTKLLTYGPGVPAPWNAPEDKNPDAAKERDAREPRIPDARVYATWEYESKDYRTVSRVMRKENVQKCLPLPTSTASAHSRNPSDPTSDVSMGSATLEGERARAKAAVTEYSASAASAGNCIRGLNSYRSSERAAPPTGRVIPDECFDRGDVAFQYGGLDTRIVELIPGTLIAIFTIYCGGGFDRCVHCKTSMWGMSIMSCTTFEESDINDLDA